MNQGGRRPYSAPALVHSDQNPSNTPTKREIQVATAATTTDIRNYDLEAIATWPEHAVLRSAIDAFARRLDIEGGPLSRSEYVEALADMARTSVYADVCDGCFELRWT